MKQPCARKAPGWKDIRQRGKVSEVQADGRNKVKGLLINYGVYGLNWHWLFLSRSYL